MTDFLNEVKGQEQSKKIIRSILNTSKIPHAFLFTGKEGIGKFHFAIKMLQTINSQNSSDKEKDLRNQKLILRYAEPLVKLIFALPRGKNENDSSSPFEKLSQDEIQLITSELETKIINPYHKIVIPKANDIKISSVRDINRFLSFSYDDVKFRSVIIIDAHLMNEPSQNALLKNLEEPPDGVLFILITPYPEQLRETIRSRCWQINFQTLEAGEISEILNIYYSVEKKLSEKIAAFSNGSIENALTLLDYDIDKLLEQTISFLRFSLGGRFDEALITGNWFISQEKSDMLKILISLILTWLSDVVRSRKGDNNIFFNEYSDTIKKFNSRFQNISLSEIMFVLDQLSSEIDRNVNQNIILLKMVYELAFLISRSPARVA